MKRVINKSVHMLLAVAYVFVGYHSLTIMWILLTNTENLKDMACAVIVDILWALLLFLGGVLVYSILFTKTKSNGTNQ